jgi:outer membrane lipoprotein
MRNKLLYRIIVPMLIGLLSSCTTTPVFETSGVDSSLTPQRVLAEPASSLGKTVLWGGTILDTRNLKDATRIEILAYPLDASHWPLQEDQPLGRFIIQHPGYLEPTNYAQGRVLTVLGRVGNSQSGKVGESEYTYPVIIAEQLHLWAQDSMQRNTRFHLGIGIGL